VPRRQPPRLHGLAVIDKEAGWTSHDVVAVARRVLGERRVGHSGTLDPDATGLLLVGVGAATRLLRFLTALDKTYTGEVVLGVETTTLDAAGTVTRTHEMDAPSLAEVRAAAAGLTGRIEQVPPMVSAVKVEGRRLHELARAGIELERAARPVTVHRFDVAATDDPLVYRLEVECSSGTYVRSLAADLGHRLGGGAHLRALRRTRIGSFTEAEAVPVAGLTPEALLTPAEALRDYPRVCVEGQLAVQVRQGRVLPAIDVAGAGPPMGPWAVVDADGALLAVYEPHGGGTVKPAAVIAAQP
jgi:tRNA pseudouridine55 synthase